MSLWSQGTLPQTLRMASVTLLLKPGKDADECGSYRPISLLNADYKILVKALAMRLETVIHQIISDDQTGFISNRHSFSNIRRLLHVIYSPASEEVPEMVISLDAEKAFDTVEWPYLFRVGFGHRFVSWVKLVYSSPKASVITNRLNSEYFNLHRGTHQGCPLSPLLFALAIEPLSIALKTSLNISGILRWGIEHKVSLYADDLLVYISDPVKSAPALIQILRQFGPFSGHKLNFAKSESFPLKKCGC